MSHAPEGVSVAELKPATDEVRQWKLMGIGALGVTGLAAMALGVTFSEALKRIGVVIIGKGKGNEKARR
ncbi:DUF1515 family protein [Sinorhizobium sp. RAC02]|uniref:DUF1515 family protein n=1 Tax=Sinorhizobium sp. RAC02 TaxID=1842534 RepID=UPI00083E0AF6|nr:DUF1515 family protein [Sinorhizobium sp. RAC02]